MSHATAKQTSYAASLAKQAGYASVKGAAMDYFGIGHASRGLTMREASALIDALKSGMKPEPAAPERDDDIICSLCGSDWDHAENACPMGCVHGQPEAY